MKRGVVFLGNELLQLEGSTGFRMGRAIDATELNYLTLYWDKLVAPTNNLMHITIVGEDELISCGVLSRPKYNVQGSFDGNNMPHFYAETQTRTFNYLRNQSSDTDWRMHSFNTHFNINPEDSLQKTTLRFELGKLLPVPQSTVPISEILEFKERRSDELAALHGYLDELYFEVLSSQDFNLQKAKALSGLKKSIEDLQKLNNGGWQSPITFNISSSFEFDLNQLASGVMGGVAAINSENPLAVLSTSAVLVLLGGFIKVKPQLQSVLKDGNPKLAYLTKANSEGVINLNH
ncbi:MAG: hypothetical protein K0S90_563 [Enterobacteriaceae bacterium]|jgi:hypothetical protein|uniref:DUF6236 family protein n=1 Tax=Pseudescherichia sp. TaxID=2055881 RepID=UPI0028A067A7|nr:DUF6236 family protein [Pseudescherichia sp.]MDF2777040.1 hypothetical protein [Enterobacteriaceae bacterium]